MTSLNSGRSLRGGVTLAALLLAGCHAGDAQILALIAIAMYGWIAVILQFCLLIRVHLKDGARFSVWASAGLGILGLLGLLLSHLTVLEAPAGARLRVVTEAFWMPAAEAVLLVLGALRSLYRASTWGRRALGDETPYLKHSKPLWWVLAAGFTLLVVLDAVVFLPH